jgi:hypothetical protein
VDEFNLMQLFLAIGDCMLVEMVPARRRIDAPQTVATWRQDPDGRKGWWRVKREFNK